MKNIITLIITILILAAFMTGCSTQATLTQEEPAPVTGPVAADVVPAEEPEAPSEEPEVEVQTVELVLPIEVPEDFMWPDALSQVEYKEESAGQSAEVESIKTETPLTLDSIKEMNTDDRPQYAMYFMNKEDSEEETPEMIDGICYMQDWEPLPIESGLSLYSYGQAYSVNCETGTIIDETPILGTEGIYQLQAAINEDGDIVFYIPTDAQLVIFDDVAEQVEPIETEHFAEDDTKTDSTTGNTGGGSKDDSGSNSGSGSSGGSNPGGGSGESSASGGNPTPSQAPSNPDPSTSEPQQPQPTTTPKSPEKHWSQNQNTGQRWYAINVVLS